MIFVLLGTQDKPFYRLLKAIDRACMLGDITDKVIVQAGNTFYTPNKLSTNMKILNFINNEKYEKYYNDADLIITHGGVGSIMNALKKGKNVIAIPRLKKYKEHTNDHQIQICEKLDKEGYLLYLKDLDKLSDYIKKIKNLRFKKFESNTGNILTIIKDYIK